jgi:predicted dehydrogenase
MIGVSGHVGYVWEALRHGADATVVALASGSVGEELAPLAAACRELGHQPVCFDDCERLLDACRLDGVVVAPWFGDHARIACAVLARGIPCFVEKPVALTLAELAAVQAAQARAQTMLMPMLGLRYDPAMFTAWQTIRAGAIGAVRLITAQKSYRLGTRPAFYQQRATYGGTIPWVGSHAIDWMLWLSGKQPRSVHASHSCQHNREHGAMESSALCHFVLEDEVLAGIALDYLRPSSAPSHGDDRVRVVGTDGILEVRNNRLYLLSDQAGGERELPLENPGRIFDDFLGAIRGERQPLCNHEDAFRVTQACLFARQSADEGRTVCW